VHGRAAGHRDDGVGEVGRSGDLLDDPGGQVVLCQHLSHPLGRAVARVHDDDPVAVAPPAGDVADRPLHLASVGVGRLGRQPSADHGTGDDVDVRLGGLDQREVRLDAEGAHRPPGLALPERVLTDVGDGPVRRSAHVGHQEVDRRRTPTGRGRPARTEELLARRHQVVRSTACALGVEHEHVGVVGHQVDEQLHLVHEHRGERLHALDGDAGGDLVGELEELRVLAAELGGPLPDLVGEQQLAAGRGPEPLHLVEGALVGDGEGADLLDVVAPELHPQGVLLGRREDVDDAAAHRELAALLHEVDARVRRGGEAPYDVLERRGVTGHQLDGLEVGQPLDLRLQHRPDGRDHHLEGTVRAVRARVPQAPQHCQATTDRVTTRAQPLVRQRLPARVVTDQRRVDQVGE
jgi:hypothetical protein